VPTRLYLRNVTAANTPTAGEKSAALPAGTFKGNSGAGFEDLSLLTTKGTAQVSKAITSLAQTAHQDLYIARFTSGPLAAQTIPAQTWTLAVATSESNTNANTFTIVSLYVWRPGTSSVVGYIYDSDTALGVEWATTEDGQVLTFSGSSIAVQAGDVLVLEFWAHAVQGMAASYTNTLFFNGTTDVTDTTTADAASYLESPAILTFAASPTKGRISWSEFETPFVPTKGRLSWIELEVPFQATQGRISFVEFETPFSPTHGRFSWVEFEAPVAPTRGRTSWLELEVPSLASPTQGQLSFAELEVPLTATRGRFSWVEFETPISPTRGRLSWVELETPIAPTKGRASWFELEIPALTARGRISWTEFQIPDVSGAGISIWQVRNVIALSGVGTAIILSGLVRISAIIVVSGTLKLYAGNQGIPEKQIFEGTAPVDESIGYKLIGRERSIGILHSGEGLYAELSGTSPKAFIYLA